MRELLREGHGKGLLIKWEEKESWERERRDDMNNKERRKRNV